MRQTKPRRPRRPKVIMQEGGKTVGPLRLKSYIEKGRLHGMWDVYFCRGEKCPRGPASKELSKHRCPDCVKGDPGETLGHLMNRIKQIGNN